MTLWLPKAAIISFLDWRMSCVVLKIVTEAAEVAKHDNTVLCHFNSKILVFFVFFHSCIYVYMFYFHFC